MSAKILRMRFEDDLGRTRSIAIQNPVDSPSESDVEDLMDHIIDENIFITPGGSLKEKVDAVVVTTSTDVIWEPSE